MWPARPHCQGQNRNSTCPQLPSRKGRPRGLEIFKARLPCLSRKTIFVTANSKPPLPPRSARVRVRPSGAIYLVKSCNPDRDAERPAGHPSPAPILTHDVRSLARSVSPHHELTEISLFRTCNLQRLADIYIYDASQQWSDCFRCNPRARVHDSRSGRREVSRSQSPTSSKGSAECLRPRVKKTSAGRLQKRRRQRASRTVRVLLLPAGLLSQTSAK